MSAFYEGEPQGFRPQGWVEPVYGPEWTDDDIRLSALDRIEMWKREFPTQDNFHLTDRELAALARVALRNGKLNDLGQEALAKYERTQTTL